MKVVILAGGLGTRLTEETEIKPKPMVEIGGRPILWHIMKHYSFFGFKEFFIALGYKGNVIKKYFIDYYSLNNNLTIHLKNGRVTIHEGIIEDWIVNLMDTGLDTNTGGRIKRLEPLLKDDPFMATYGDGVSNINLQKLIAFHHGHGRIATVSAVRPPARFGELIFDGNIVKKFQEKPQIHEGWINGGFLVFNPEIFEFLEGDESSLEADAMEKLANDNQLAVYKHDQFWQCMDTLRDKRLLEKLWSENKAEWKVWV